MKGLIASIILGVFITTSIRAQHSVPTLRDDAVISILTCSPGDELYEAFGHSAIRVRQPGMFDQVYNYGIFSDKVENFYLNFARGLLLYRIGRDPFQRFMAIYKHDRRRINEQVLNLTTLQKNRLFSYLERNMRPENAEYLYQYFDDNCASRLVFVMDSVEQIEIQWNGQPHKGYAEHLALLDRLQLGQQPFVQEQLRYRDMVNYFAEQHPWLKLGMNLCLGLPVDRKLKPQDFSFLPEYLMLQLTQAEIRTENGAKPLVKSQQVLADYRVSTESISWWQKPTLLLNLLWAVLLLVAWRLGEHKIWMKGFDTGLFVFSGLIGLFLLAMWLLTDHYHTAWNLNLIWANPIYLVVPFTFRKKGMRQFLRINTFLLLVLLIGWFTFIPQYLPPALFGLVLLLAYRCLLIHRATY